LDDAIVAVAAAVGAGGLSGNGEDSKCDGTEVCAGWIGFEERDEGWCAFEYVS